MARNEEKANAMLNRWIEQKEHMEKGKGMFAERRPKIASECKTVKECERWRTGIVREVSRKIAEIQNAGLGEHRIRDLNDEINKLLREKSHWETQIKDIGGRDYKEGGGIKQLDALGAELATGAGYKYFGVAKELPGVRELFEQEAPPAPKKTRMDLFKNLQPDYYGWRDEEDAMLLLEEQKAEAESSATRETVYEKKEKTLKRPLLRREPVPEAKRGVVEFKAYVNLPSTDDLQELLLKKKKDMLLAKYATPEARASELASEKLSKLA